MHSLQEGHMIYYELAEGKYRLTVQEYYGFGIAFISLLSVVL